MAEIRSGFSWPSLINGFFIIGIVAWLAFTATSKTNDENYAKGAQHNETTITIAPVQHVYPLSLPPNMCGAFFKIDEQTIRNLTSPKPQVEQPKAKK